MTRRWSRNRRRAPFLVAVCVLCASASSTAAQTLPCTKIFALDDNGTWHDDEHWNPIGIPEPSDVACILEGDVFRVTVDQPVTVAGLEISGPDDRPRLVIRGTTFTLNGPGLVSRAARIRVKNGAELRSDAGGLLDIQSKLVVDNATVSLDLDLYGVLRFKGTGQVTGNLQTHPGSEIRIEEDASAGDLVFSNGFDNNGGLFLSNDGAQSISILSGALVNTEDGAIVATGDDRGSDQSPELRLELINRGRVEIDGVDLYVGTDGANHSNELGGTIDVASGELVLDLGGVADAPSNFTNYGTVTVAGGGSVRVVTTSGLVDVPSNFTNYGTVTVAGGGQVSMRGDVGGGGSLQNNGLIELATGAELELIDAVLDNPAKGELRGTGTVDLTGATSVFFDGVIAPGHSPGVLTVEGPLTVAGNAEFEIEIGGESVGSGHDRLAVTEAYGAAGELAVSLLDTYHPEGGESYRIVTYASFTGGFDTVSLPPLDHFLAWNLNPQPQELHLDVVCEGTQLAVGFEADRAPVSVDHEVFFNLTIANLSPVGATQVVVSNPLPAELMFHADLSSPECALVGPSVECTVSSLAPLTSIELLIAAEALTVGLVESIATVDSWECDTEPLDDRATAAFTIVAAEPCDANSDFVIDGDDLEPAVQHILGTPAAGNPDCRLGKGITADDLAAIIVATD